MSKANAWLCIFGDVVERLKRTRFRRVALIKQLTWTSTHLKPKPKPKTFFPGRLKQARLPQKLLVDLYRSTTRSILTSCVTVWYACWAEIPTPGDEDCSAYYGDGALY